MSPVALLASPLLSMSASRIDDVRVDAIPDGVFKRLVERGISQAQIAKSDSSCSMWDSCKWEQSGWEKCTTP